MPTALLDTTLLSNFAQVQQPDLLQRALGDEAATTPTIMAELKAGEERGFVPACDWHWLRILEPTAEEQALAHTLEQELDAGEAECLAVAQMRGFTFLSDDFAARRLARQHHLAVSGTIGVLLALVEGQALSVEEADQLLDEMIRRGYRSPVSSLRELIS